MTEDNRRDAIEQLLGIANGDKERAAADKAAVEYVANLDTGNQKKQQEKYTEEEIRNNPVLQLLRKTGEI